VSAGTATAETGRIEPRPLRDIAEGRALCDKRFTSVEEAENFVEPWFVREDTLRGFDANGRLLRFEVERQSVGDWFKTTRKYTNISFASGFLGCAAAQLSWSVRWPRLSIEPDLVR